MSGEKDPTVVSGAAAADATTLAAINAINALPNKLTLAHEGAVLAARAAYDLIASLEQRALVTNYLKLTQAEQQIADLKYLQQTQPEDPGNIDDNNQKPKLDLTTEQIIISLNCKSTQIVEIKSIIGSGVWTNRTMSATQDEFLNPDVLQPLCAIDIDDYISGVSINDSFAHLILYFNLALYNLIHLYCPLVILIHR